MEGIKFRRQHPLQKYVADFYAHELKLVIELDGKYHEEKSQSFYDKDRDQNIGNKAVLTLRFTNEEILNSLEEVLNRLRNKILILKSQKKLK